MQTIEEIKNVVKRMCADDIMDIVNSLGAYGRYNLRREAKAHGMTTCAYLRQELPGIIYEQNQREAQAEAVKGRRAA